MPQLPKWELSHIGLFVTDMDRVRDFYTGLLGYRVMDAGEVRSGVRLTFLSKDPRDHHQIVLVTGREKGTRSTVNQITYRVASLKEVRAMYEVAVANNVEGVDPVDHGNAWSVYFLDPEGNRLEFFCDTPWYVAQPHRVALDFSLSDEEIEQATYRRIAGDPTTEPFAQWRDRKRRELGAAN
ncbi:MAG TPA: VOC family protein [Burkholderiales bacterium]|jgi:catechol 2,3-dioxygenase-like lactoylglutathione lyase family enzyme|nr:VOC family protein [Burkholderiales bacterium]